MPLWKRNKTPVVQTKPSGTSDMYHRDPSGLRRELSPEFGGTSGREWGADFYIRTICHVCRLQLFPAIGNPNFPAAQFPDQVQYNTPGGLSLCKRHYDLVNSLIEKKISIDKWPSQLIRGIVTFAKAYLQAGNDGVIVAQRALGSIQTTKNIITPAPIFGNTYNPASTFGGTGTFSYDFLIFPMQRQVVDQNAVNEVNWSQQYLQLSQQRVQTFGQQVAKYSGLLERVRKENPPKFVTCLRCGQSEMPLGTKVCTWCGQSQGYTGEAVPVPCLVEDVDPLNVVSAYGDRTGTKLAKEDKVEMGQDDITKEDDQNKKGSSGFCTQCGSKLGNSAAQFCDVCGAKVDSDEIGTAKGKSKEDHVLQNQGDSKGKQNQSKPDDNPKVDPRGNVKGEVIGQSRSSVNKEQFRYCPECGKELKFGDAKFCPYCGKKIPLDM